jgi:hypothetical protein
VRDTPIDRLIRKSLSAGVRSPEDHSVNDNLMAAYLESNLSTEEASAFEAHVADCAVCQETLAVALKLGPPEDAPGGELASAPSKKTLFRISIPIPAIAALLLCLGIAAVFFGFYNRPGGIAAKQQVADLRAPSLQHPLQAEQKAKALSPAAAPAVGPPVEVATRARQKAVSERKGQPADTTSGFARGDVSVPTPVMALSQMSADVLPTDSPAGNVAVADAKKSDKDVVGKISGEGNTLMSDSGKREELGVNIPGSGAGSVSPMPPMTSAAQPVAPQPLVLLNKSNAQDEAAAPARTQEPFPRPHIYAATNRIATTLYETESPESNIRFVIKSLDFKQKSADTKTIGDRVFHKNRGYWIDKRCAENSGDPIVIIQSADPGFASITQKYPDIRAMLPAIIYWEKQNFVLSK